MGWHYIAYSWFYLLSLWHHWKSYPMYQPKSKFKINWDNEFLLSLFVVTSTKESLCSSVILSLQGLIQGGVNWVASHPPLGVQSPLFEHTLWFTWTNHSCKPSIWWDANQSLRQGKQRIINIFRTRKPNSVACFILFMMMVEHWQQQEHMDWHKAINMP